MRFGSNFLKKYTSRLKTLFCVKNFRLPIILKNAFCIKCVKKLQVAVENFILLQTLFCKIIRISFSKMRFSSNLLKTYKSLLKTSFCVKNFLLPNYKAILLKNAFCFTSAQRIARCVENSVSRHFVLKTSFCQLIGRAF